MQKRSLAAAIGAVVLLLTPGRTATLSVMVPPAAAFSRNVPARKAAQPKRKVRLSADECSALAMTAAIAKARAELGAIVPQAHGDPAAIDAAMRSDRRLAENVKRTLANSDLISSSYSKRGECVVTLKLSVERLQKLGRDL